LEIVKKPDQVSGFGLPLSTMSRKSATPSVSCEAAAAAAAPFDPQSLISPFKIRGQIEPGHSPNIFSPTCHFDEELEDDDIIRSIHHSERFLSQFFETSAIDRVDAGTISFASACDGDDSDQELEEQDRKMSLADEMTVMAKLIQESWTGYGPRRRHAVCDKPLQSVSFDFLRKIRSEDELIK
jgi:hypothetical protein